MSRDRLAARLRALGPDERPAPPFRRVWRAALERRDARRRRRRILRGVATLSAAALVIALLAGVPGLREAPPAASSEAHVRELARSLSNWSGPLDSVLEPRGERFLALDPESTAMRVPAYLSNLEIEEIL